MHICIIVIQGNEKTLMMFAFLSTRTLKTVKCWLKILFNIDTMDLCLLRCFCILFKRQMESVTKVFISKVVLPNLKISEPID